MFVELFLSILSAFCCVLGLYIVVTCFIGSIRYSDYFIRLHAIKISNIYGINIILLSFILTASQLRVVIQILLCVCLNLVINFVVFHVITRVFLIKNKPSSSIPRKRYNEMMKNNEQNQTGNTNN